MSTLGTINNPFLIKEFNRSLSKNKDYNVMVMHYFEELHNLAISSIEIENLPIEIEEFFMNDILFFGGSGLMIREPVFGMYGFTAFSETDSIDAYGHGFIRYSYATPDWLEEYDKTNSVIFRDRPTGTPIANDIMMYAQTLANLWLTRELNLNAMKTPVVIKAPKEMQLSYKIMTQDVQNYVPILQTDNDLDLDRIQVLDLNAPIIFDKIESQIHQVKMQALSFLGFDVSAVEKRERVQSADAEQNQEENFGNRTMRLRCYKRSCEQANRLWGLDLNPVFATESYIDARNFLYMEKEQNISFESEKEEGEENANE